MLNFLDLGRLALSIAISAFWFGFGAAWSKYRWRDGFQTGFLAGDRASWNRARQLREHINEVPARYQLPIIDANQRPWSGPAHARTEVLPAVPEEV